MIDKFFNAVNAFFGELFWPVVILAVLFALARAAGS